MEKAKVAIFEDDSEIRELIGDYLLMRGHDVVAEAQDLPTALDIVEQIGEGKIEVDAVLLDGNLHKGPKDGADAKKIATAMREAGITAAVIGFSQNPMSNYGIQTFHDSQKSPSAVMDALQRL